jgi:hypothetical protein
MSTLLHRVRAALAACGIALVLCGTGPARADVTEGEPNDSCATAQVAAEPAVSGTIAAGDVDFFRFDLTPSTDYIARVRRAGTQAYPLVGAFDGSCTLAASDSAYYYAPEETSTEQRSAASGALTIGVATDFNISFAPGTSTQVMPYALRLMPKAHVTAHVAIIDAVTRERIPLESGYLERCDNEDCSAFMPVASDSWTPKGIAVFENPRVAVGDRLRVSTYPRAGSSNVYLPGSSRIVEATGDGTLTFPPLALLKPAIALESAHGRCLDGIETGTACDIVVSVQNRRHTQQRLRLWGIATIVGDVSTGGVQFGAIANKPNELITTVSADAAAEFHLILALPPHALRPSTFTVRLYGALPTDIANPYFAVQDIARIAEAGGRAKLDFGPVDDANVND